MAAADVLTTNWAGNVVFGARALHHPGSVAEVQQVVARSERVRVLGTGHSFSPVADTAGDLLRLDRLPRVLEVDTSSRSVQVSAGLTYGEVAAHLHEHGLALANLGSLPHISVAGACSTGTHGSGDANQVLAASVLALQLVTADGSLLELDRERDATRFDGAVVALGTLGVVTRLTLAVVPAFDLTQEVRERLPLDTLVEHLDEVMAAGYSVSVFTDWSSPVAGSAWVKRPAEAAPLPGDWLGTVAADGPRHPVAGMPTEHSTQQLGEPGPWHERLPHFRMHFVPSSGDELQSEYLVPREHGASALRAVESVAAVVAPVLQVGEVRSIAADRQWLSAAHGRDSLGLHFTWVPDAAAVAPAVSALERVLEPFEPRPHWGKVFSTDPAIVGARYPRLADFVALRDELDPRRRFANEFVDTYLGA